MALAGALVPCGAGSAFGATLQVDNDAQQCPRATFTTIQAAVDAAAATATADLVLVCPGLYREQVRIGPGNNGDRILSNVTQAAIISAPVATSGPRAVVHIGDGATNVEVSRFVIKGPFQSAGSLPALGSAGIAQVSAAPDCAEGPLWGVLVDGRSRARRLVSNRITDIRELNPDCAATGTGLEVREGSRVDYAAANTIDKYSHNGVVIAGNLTFALLTSNTIVGGGEGVPNPQYGVILSEGAQGHVLSNVISENVGPPADDDGAGVAVGLSPEGGVSTTNVRVSANRLRSNYYGLLIDNLQNALLSRNLTQSNEVGILVDDFNTKNNRFDHNDARTNTQDDCVDLTFEGVNEGPPGPPYYETANTWVGNRGVTSSPPEICTPDGRGQPGG